MTEWQVADDGEAWVLASEVVGWVRPEEAERARTLTDEVAALEARRASLDAEIGAAVEAGRAAGFAQGAGEASELVAALRLVRSRDVARAAEAALFAAEALTAESLAERGALARALVERALSSSAPREARRVLVAPSLVRPLSAVLPSLTIEVGAELAVGDVVLEFDDGQQVQTLGGLLSLFLDDIARHLVAL